MIPTTAGPGRKRYNKSLDPGDTSGVYFCHMEIRKAKTDDISAIMRIRDIAKKRMRSDGNMNQWIGSYPSEELFLSDIEEGNLYAITDGGTIHAFFYFAIGIEPSYWNLPADCEYGTIHRIASDGEIRNVLRTAVDYAMEKVSLLRIDTHRDNKRMQHQIAKCGFEFIGIIHLISDGTERLCYEKRK